MVAAPDEILRATHLRTVMMLDRLDQLVNHETPPGSTAALATCAELLESWGNAALGRRARRVVVDGLPHLLWPADDQRVLLLGHFDTVWPAGTIAHWPFQVTGAIATGPGVCDMKAGIVQMLTAAELVADQSRLGVLLTCDEESGSPTSRPLIEREARRSGAVLVCEPSTEDGLFKVARKGGSSYQIMVRGRAAHAGAEPHHGVNATVEAAHHVLAVQAFGSGDTSVTPTVLTAGTQSNVIPEMAIFSVDVRAWTADELHRVDALMRELTPWLPGARLVVRGGVNRYPMPREVALPLLDLARAAANEIGIAPIEGVAAAGASDGNFTGALGVPTLDGLGGVGGQAHARGEYVNVGMMADRAALLAVLIDSICAARR